MSDPTLVEDPCPISPAVDVLMGRWTSPILWMLVHHGGLRFNQVRERLPAITPKVLTQRLRQLERDGLVTRTYHPEVPPRVEYEVTALGRTLVPLFALLGAWSEEHIGDVLESRRRYDADGRKDLHGQAKSVGDAATHTEGGRVRLG